jgi:hypothetical protein
MRAYLKQILNNSDLRLKTLSNRSKNGTKRSEIKFYYRISVSDINKRHNLKEN